MDVGGVGRRMKKQKGAAQGSCNAACAPWSLEQTLGCRRAKKAQFKSCSAAGVRNSSYAMEQADCAKSAGCRDRGAGKEKEEGLEGGGKGGGGGLTWRDAWGAAL